MSCFVLTDKKRPSVWGFSPRRRRVSWSRRTGALIPERTDLRSADRSNFRSTQGRRSWREDLRLRAVTLPLIGPAYKNKSFEHKQKKTGGSYQCEARHWRSEVTETPIILDGPGTDRRASDRKIIDYWLLMEEQEAAQTSDKSASTTQEVPADSKITSNIFHIETSWKALKTNRKSCDKTRSYKQRPKVTNWHTHTHRLKQPLPQLQWKTCGLCGAAAGHVLHSCSWTATQAQLLPSPIHHQ